MTEEENPHGSDLSEEHQNNNGSTTNELSGDNLRPQEASVPGSNEDVQDEIPLYFPGVDSEDHPLIHTGNKEDQLLQESPVNSHDLTGIERKTREEKREEEIGDNSMEPEPVIIHSDVDATGKLDLIISDYINSVTIRREGLIEEEKFVSFKSKRPRTFFLPKERELLKKYYSLIHGKYPYMNMKEIAEILFSLFYEQDGVEDRFHYLRELFPDMDIAIILQDINLINSLVCRIRENQANGLMQYNRSEESIICLIYDFRRRHK